MANWDSVSIECANGDVIQEVYEGCKFVIHPDNTKPAEGATKWTLDSRNGKPFECILEVSKCYPNEEIQCKISFEADRYSKLHILEIKNGESALIEEKQLFDVGEEMATSDEEIEFCESDGLPF